MMTLTEIISYIIRKAWEQFKRFVKPMPVCHKGENND